MILPLMEVSMKSGEGQYYCGATALTQRRSLLKVFFEDLCNDNNVVVEIGWNS